MAQDSDGYLAKKAEQADGLKSSLDQKIYDAVKEQAGEAGLECKDGPNF